MSRKMLFNLRKCLFFLFIPFFMLSIAACSDNREKEEVPIDPSPIEVTMQSVKVIAGASSLVADGESSTTIAARVIDTEGAPMAGIEVRFETSAGTLSAATGTTDQSGVAETSLTSARSKGSARVTATAGNFTDGVTLEFRAGEPAKVEMTASPGTLNADGISTSRITITVTDANQNMADITPLNLRVDYGSLSEYMVNTTGGRATVTYTAPVSSGASQDLVYADISDGPSGSTNITLIGPQVATITLSASPASLPADGDSQSIITAQVTTPGGGFVPDGTQVEFTIIDDGGGEITAASTTMNGSAMAILTSDSVPGEATIRAKVGIRIAQIKVVYTPGSVSVNTIPNSILGIGGGTQKAEVLVNVKDSSGNPVDGDIVRAVVSDLSVGKITPSQQTLVNGNAVFSFTSEGKGGTATIMAFWKPDGADEISGEDSIDVFEPPAFIESVGGYPDPLSVNIVGTGGQSTSRVVLSVKDVFGQPVADGYRVNFQLLDGPGGGEALDPVSAVTREGQVSTIFRSGTKAGPINIKATYHHNTNVSAAISNLAINAGHPVGEEFGISARHLNVAGLHYAFLENPIAVNVADLYGNAVPDGTAINFKTYNTGGFISENTGNTLGGVATSAIISGGTNVKPLNGFLSVTAEASSGGRTTHITSIAVDPSDSNILFAGTSGGGVYKSINEGNSWENISRTSDHANLGQNFIDPYINDLCINPDNPNMIYAATGYWGRGGIFRSTDGGLRWNSGNHEEWGGLLGAGSSTLAIVCDKGSDYVWAGTEGMGAILSTDGNYFRWGGRAHGDGVVFDPDGKIDPLNTGDYSLLITGIGVTALTEKWTLENRQIGASISRPEFDNISGRGADGTMTGVSAFRAKNETWTVTYLGGSSAVDKSGTSETGLVDLTIIGTSASTINETWRVRCTDQTAGEEKFIVIGSVSGVQEDPAEVNKNYETDDNQVKFYITGTGSFQVGDVFVFHTYADDWKVEGTESGMLKNAKTDIPYEPENNEISFTINSGEKRFYGNGDQWYFYTRIISNWQVSGEKSGTQANQAYTFLPYTSDHGEVSFIIYDDIDAPFEVGDKLEFDVTASGLGYGRTVRDIASAGGIGESAVLFAGTPNGIFKTTDGGAVWTKTGSFTGDNITSIAAHPMDGNTIYAGTQEFGVWYSTDGGNSWIRFTNGLGGGLRATSPVADLANIGSGIIDDLVANDNAKTENWTVVFDGTNWKVSGTVSGLQEDNVAMTGSTYLADQSAFSFVISPGSVPFESGDTFRFKTIRDPGLNIKDLQVYHDQETNAYYLYAITYFYGAREALSAGNVYMAELNTAGNYAPQGEWMPANVDLPEIDPPDDTTLFAQNVLAVDKPTASGALFIGGHGINFFKASNKGLKDGMPIWKESNIGLSNRIMARMPILLSGNPIMDVYEVYFNEETGEVIYHIYIEDENGNPPILGSTFTYNRGFRTYSLFTADGGFEYPDTYSSIGTWSDPSDLKTNRPIVIRTRLRTQRDEDSMHFVFEPGCWMDGDEVVSPGCWGSDQSISFTYYFE